MTWEDCYDHDDYQPDWRTLRQSTHTARLTHTCGLCNGIIQIGHKYRVTVALDEGEFKVYREHHQGECLSLEEQRAIELHIQECENLAWEQYAREDEDWRDEVNWLSRGG